MRIRLLAFASLFIVAFSTPGRAQNSNLPVSIGEGINSTFDEITPIISPDGNTLYFTRRNHPENTFFRKNNNNTDIWYAERSSDGTWKEAIHMPSPFNKRIQNSIESISPDGNIIYVRGAYENGKFVGNGISRSYRTESGWSTPQKMEIKRFKKLNKGVTSNFFVTPDGKRLVMSFSRVDKSKLNDLFFSFLKNDSTWSKPRKMNFPINTREYTEESPFLASDGVTLYFSSDREGSLGKNDIFVSRRKNKNWTKWSAPIPLDSPINTSNWEAYYCVDAKGDFAYYVSAQNVAAGGKPINSDIVRVYLKEEFRPNPVALLSGRFLEYRTGKPVTGLIRFYDAGTNTEIAITRSEPETGEFKMTLPLGKMYYLTAKANGYLPVNEYLDLQSVYNYKELNKDLTAIPIFQIKGVTANIDRQADILKNAKLNYFELDSSLLELNLANGSTFDLLPVSNYYTAVLRSVDPLQNSLNKALEGKNLSLVPMDIFSLLSNDEKAEVKKQLFLQSDEINDDTLALTLPSRKRLTMIATSENSTLKQEEISGNLVAYVNDDLFDKISYIPLNEIQGLSNIEKLQLLNKALILPLDKTDGSFELTLLTGKKYTITPTLDGYTAVPFDTVALDKEEDWATLDKVEEDATVQVGNTVRIDNLFFDFGTASIRQESYPSLDQLVRIMNDNPKMEIFVKGHSDDIGSEEANLRMSMKRAEAVRTYLIQHKIHPYRILFQGYGSMMPVLADETEKARQLNRRVEFTVIKR